MSIIWPQSGIPFLNSSGVPHSGAKAYFFDEGTTTPRTVYSESALGEPHDHPVVANSSGIFPAVFLPPGNYKVQIKTSDGATTIYSADGISTPLTGDEIVLDAGSTDPDLLLNTGEIFMRFGTSARSGAVRCNGRTIGSASSGASERANADCEDLFLFLYAQDASLAVSGGRGANAASDWAANKTIALPDFRDRAPFGLGGMGNSAAGLIADSLVDSSETSDTLGATFGASTVTLTTTELPAHTHTGTTGTESQSHAHNMGYDGKRHGANGASFSDALNYVPDGDQLDNSPDTFNIATGTASQTHTHSFTTASTGSGAAFSKLPPGLAVQFLIKL